MPHNVIVSGLPEIPKLNKLVFIFKAVLQKVGITKFWIRKLEKLPNSNLRHALVEFYSSDEAYSAVKSLDGYKFLLGNTFPLSARVDGPIPHSSGHRSRSPHERERRMESRNYRYMPALDQRDHRDSRARKRSRSRSPFVLEASELDLEIELLKKKRLIIEEERRLLMERKKLELVQAFGPSAIREFDDVDEPRDQDRRFRSRRSPEPYRGRRPSPRPRPRPRPRSPLPRDSRLRPPRHVSGLQLSRPTPQPTVSSERSKDRETIPGLPQFVMPCKLILKEMTDMVVKHATPVEIGHVRNLIRSALRSRLAVIMDKQPHLGLEDIVKLYRVSHPLATDEQFVIKQVKNLRACHLPEMTRSSKPNTKGDSNKAKVPANQELKGVGIPGKVKLANTDKTAAGNDVKTKVKNDEDNEMKTEPNDSVKSEIKEDKLGPVSKTEVNAENLNKEEPRTPESDQLPSASSASASASAPAPAINELANQVAVDDDWATGGDGWTDWNTKMDSEAMEDQLITKIPNQ